MEENTVKEETKEVKAPKVKKPLWRRILSWFFSILVGLIVAFALVFQIETSITRGSNYGVGNFFGYQTLVIATDSMEPKYKVGSGIIVKKVSFEDISVGDDITFYYTSLKVVMTHEVLTKTENSDGTYTFICHGINKNSTQCSGDCTYQTQTVEGQYVLGKVIKTSDFIGVLYNYLLTPYGLVTLILIPGAYLIISSIFDVVKAAKATDKVNKDQNTDHLNKLSQEEREALKEDLLNEMLENKANKNDNKKDDVDKDKEKTNEK